MGQHREVMPLTTDAMLLGSWSPLYTGVVSPVKILDIGTGTGILALMLAQRFSRNEMQGFSIKALDIDPSSVALARDNFKASRWEESLSAEEVDFNAFSGDPSTVGFNQIISNPPFFINSLPAQSKMGIRSRHEIDLSLNRLLEGVKQLLTDDGIASIILPADRHSEAEKMIHDNNLQVTATVEVRLKVGGGYERVLVAFSKKETKKVNREVMDVYESRGIYSDAYKTLTKDFYL